VGDAYKQTAVICLDAKSGKPHWRIDTELPVWSRPVVDGEVVYVGTGNGRLNEAAEKPAGVVYCLRSGSGDEVWKARLPDGVLARMALDRERLYFGCRDGLFYALRRSDGQKAWSHDLGSPIVSGPALESCACCGTVGGRLYTGTLEGRLACLEPTTGRLVWSRDLVERSKVPIELVSSPVLDVRGGSRRLYVATTMISSARTGELLCFEERAGE
jgi:outer membrane protein assembly factor BamB